MKLLSLGERKKEKELKKRTGTPGPSCHRITLTGYDRSGPYGNERQGNRKTSPGDKR